MSATPAVAFLPDQSEAVQERRRVWAFLDELAGDLQDPLLWCALPVLHEAATSRPHSRRGASAAQVVTLARGAVALLRSQSNVALRVGSTLVLATTTNQRRTTAPLVQRLGAPQTVTARAGAAGTASLRRLRTLHRELLERAEARSVHFDPVDLQDRLQVAGRSLARARQLLPRGTAAVVVASQHDMVARAVVAQARSVQVPTLYVPHAPVAAVPWYEDLPTDYAALRGSREREHYAALGADGARLSVVGNPSGEFPGLPPIDPSGIPVFALSPGDPERIRALMEVVAATGSPWLVAPHPRTDLAHLSTLVRPPLRIWSGGRTSELLTSGPPCLMQSSSGVSWEALALGIPTLQLQFPGEFPPYVLLHDPRIPRVSSAAEITAALEQARDVARDPDKRADLREYALSWCSPSGAASAERLAEVVRIVAASGTSQRPLLDRWSGGRQP